MTPTEQAARARILARERTRRVRDYAMPPAAPPGEEWLALLDALHPRPA